MGGACQCQCTKPKSENPLDEILSDKDKNELTNYKNQSINSNGAFFKSQKPQEIPNKKDLKESVEKNNDINKQIEVEPPLEFYPPPIATTNNFTNENYNKDNEIINTVGKQANINENEIKEEDEFKVKENEVENNSNKNEEKNNEIKEENEEKKDNEINDKKEQKIINDIEKKSNNSFNIKSENSNELIPDDDFSQYIFKYINLIRTNPKSFIPIIEEAKKKIIKDNNRLIFKSKIKVALSQGEPVFDETIQILEKTEPMEKLKYKPEMTIPLPSTVEEIKDKSYLKIKVKEILNKNIKIKTYWKDIVKDAETSFILMIVDDSGKKKGCKRRDILNPDIKYIGISSITIEKSFVCYLTLCD